jgi:hypothetical protein
LYFPLIHPSTTLLASLGGNESLIIFTQKRLTWKGDDLGGVWQSSVECVG